MHILITAGGTREAIDPVRFISNASSGKMGYALARVALARGHDVTLITAPTSLKPPARARIIEVVSAQDMFEAVMAQWERCDGLIMAAAVSDYTVAQPASTKIKKYQGPLHLTLAPTRDILQGVAERKTQLAASKTPWVVGFALEDRDIRAAAEKKLKDKKLDMIVANRPDAIGSDRSALEIKIPGREWIGYGSATKSTQARRLLKLIETSLTG